MLKLSLVPKASYISLQKDDVNKESLSNTYATVGVVKFFQIGEKWETLVKVSIVTMMASWQ